MTYAMVKDTAEAAKAELALLATRTVYRKLIELRWEPGVFSGTWIVKDGRRQVAKIYLAGYDGRTASDFEIDETHLGV